MKNHNLYTFDETPRPARHTSSTLKACRVSLDIIAILVLLVCVILSACGLFTPAWQVGDLFELGEYHEYGLWEDCIKGWTRTAGPKNEFICFYKPIFGNQWQYNFQPFYSDEGYSYYSSQLQQQQMNQQMNQPWRLATLAFMCIFFGLSFFALFFGCCGMVFKCPAIAWAVLTTLATLCGLIAVIIFAVNTTYPANRFVLMTLTTAELRLGRSFYFSLAGAITGIIATILSIACVVLLMVQNPDYIGGRSQRANHAKQYVYRTQVKNTAPLNVQTQPPPPQQNMPGWPGWPKPPPTPSPTNGAFPKQTGV